MTHRALSALFFGLMLLASRCCALAAEPAESETIDEPRVTDFDRDHWAWRPVEHPSLPEVDDASWCNSPIDRFVLAELETAGTAPAETASRATLIRRLSFTLTGLPPSPAQVAAFEADPRPDAYERLLERLLLSDEYGRHTAQSWLDLARFAETDGFEHDKTRPTAWQYRDWVIDALNEDLGYDYFVRMQLAGDTAQPPQPIATAFCLSGPDMPDINLQEERRDFLLNDVAATIGAVFLALQTGCAQCHDHKYDPVSQADFYRLRAIVEPDLQVVKDKTLDSFSVVEGAPAESRIMLRGDWRRPGPTVQAAFPRIANAIDAQIPGDATGVERRAALADWLTRDDHPLTARVMVNRIWQQHFGRGLSETPSDFGVMGYQPNPEGLLDYLATQFVRHGWSRKWLDREILLSATYRQASVRGLPGATTPSYLWDHFPRQRLTGEQVRDAMLSISGELSSVGGGESVMPPLPGELLSTIRGDHWKASADLEEHHRRSIYIFARRNLRYPVFDVFDRPAGLASCEQRNESTTAIQSLTMLNSEFSQQVAQRIVAQAVSRGISPMETVRLIATQILPHSPSLVDRCARLSVEQGIEELAEADREPVLQDIAIALLNSNAFLYVD